MSLISSPSTSWDLALEIHIASLSPAQRAAFLSPSSADNCIALIRAARDGRKRAGLTKVLEALRPLIDSLKKFEGAIDVLVQTNGGLCSPIWSPIRMVVELAGDHLRSVEKLTKILQRVVGLLPRAETYENLFLTNENARRAIGALYTDFIDFCVRAVQYHSLPYHRFMRHDFNKEFEEVWEKINYDSQQMDWVANATSIEETKRVRELQNDRYQDEQRIALQRWLSPSNVRDDLLRIRRQLMPSSCDLLLCSSEFRRWGSGGSALLRVAGYPGAGKTYFATAAYERLEQSGEKVVYFLCKAGSKTRNHTLTVLRTLLSQILRLEKSAYDILIPLQQESGQYTADSISEIEHMFNEVLLSGLPSLYIVIDALDELTDRMQLFAALQSFLSQSSTTIKILVTARNETDITSFFAPYPSLQITSEVTQDPIENYIEKRLSDCHTLGNPDLKKAISKRVNQEADGLWLYAKLMADAVTELPSIAAIERQLRQLPHGLSEMYFQILERHADKLSPWQFEWAQQLFLWVDTEDYNWLTKGDSQSVINTSALSVVFQAVNSDWDSPIDPLSIAKLLGGPMMEIVWSEYDESKGIDYIHLSARQYIMSASNTAGHSKLPRLLKARRLRQLLRGHTALWYFNSSVAGTSNLEVYCGDPRNACIDWWDTPHPTVVYGLWDAMALTSLPVDMDMEEIAMAQNLCDLFVRFLTTDSCLVWVESSIVVNYSGNWPHLLRNAQTVLAALSTSSPSEHQFFERYAKVRWNFFNHFAHVLATTGPRYLHQGIGNDFERNLGGARFSNSTAPLPIYKALAAIGKKYQYLHTGHVELEA